MSIKPQKRRKQRQTGLTDEQIEFLLYGRNLLDQTEPPFKNEADIEPAWKENRDFLMSYRGGEYYPAFEHGRRPWGWWQFEAPEPRKQIATKEYYPLVGFHNGVRYENREAPKQVVAIFETQPEYLDRLKLWFDGEKEAYFLQEKTREFAINEQKRLSLMAKSHNFPI